MDLTSDGARAAIPVVHGRVVQHLGPGRGCLRTPRRDPDRFFASHTCRRKLAGVELAFSEFDAGMVKLSPDDTSPRLCPDRVPMTSPGQPTRERSICTASCPGTAAVHQGRHAACHDGKEADVEAFLLGVMFEHPVRLDSAAVG